MPITLASVALVGGALLLCAASVWNCFVWFRQSVLWLLLCLFVPFASLVFLVKFWSEAKRPFFLGLAGSVLVLTTLLLNAKGFARDYQASLDLGFLQGRLQSPATPTAGSLPPAARNLSPLAPSAPPAGTAVAPRATTATTMTPVALAASAPTPPPPASGVLARELQGAGVGRFQDGRWQPLPAGALEGKRHFAFYYSAHWCPPCRAFTPKLVAFYQSFAASHPDFELVFVSSDHSEADMRKYMQEAGMPWPAVPFAKVKTAHLPRSTGNGIPCLVLADADGRVLADSYAGATYLGPGKVLKDIGNLPVGGTSAPAPLLAANSPPKPATTTPGETSAGLRREMAAAATAERQASLGAEKRAAFEKHRAEADALYHDLNARRAKLKGADAATVATFNADATRYAALLEQTKTERNALEPVAAPTPTTTGPADPKLTGPIPPNPAQRGPVYVPGVVGGNPNGTKPTGAPGDQPGLYRRSLDAARAARDAASRAEENPR